MAKRKKSDWENIIVVLGIIFLFALWLECKNSEQLVVEREAEKKRHKAQMELEKELKESRGRDSCRAVESCLGRIFRYKTVKIVNFNVGTSISADWERAEPRTFRLSRIGFVELSGTATVEGKFISFRSHELTGNKRVLIVYVDNKMVFCGDRGDVV